MDTGPASPPSSMVAGPSSLWRLAERRSRKAGSGNIFSDVNLWQLQRLFKAAGDQDAEQRAQLVWGHGDEAELAQALIGLRARTHRRGMVFIFHIKSWIFGPVMPCTHQMSSSSFLLGDAKRLRGQRGDKILSVYPRSTQSCMAGATVN
uniref:Arginine vasopressin-induced protein 1 n=1 Tax=Seriola lalandi dorsalis TaxID=1841481 RepID=A0A3B4YAP4_SERLL